MATFKVEWREAGELEWEEDTVNASTIPEALNSATFRDFAPIDWETVCDCKVTEIS